MKIIRESIEFRRGEDPKRALGIGKRAAISQWLKGQGLYDDDESALVHSAEAGKLDFVKYMIADGVDPNIFDNSPIEGAAWKGHLDVVKYLHQAGADINRALPWATHQGNLDIVKYLIEEGADPTQYDGLPLIWAAEYGELEVIKFLIEKGNYARHHINRAISSAVIYNKKPTVEYLYSIMEKYPEE